MVRICHQLLSSNHFSTQLSFYWGTSLVQTDLNKLKVKCCKLEIYSVTYEKSPTIWWIKSHNSGMKNWNVTIKYTDCKTINSNNSVKFEVNWPRGVLKLERDMWNGRMDRRTLVYHNTSRLKDRRIKIKRRKKSHWKHIIFLTHLCLHYLPPNNQ